MLQPPGPPRHVASSLLDPLFLYYEAHSERRCLALASITACLFHLLIFLLVDFPVTRPIFQPSKQVLVLAKLVEPRLGAPGTGLNRPSLLPHSAPRPAPALVPIPDPTPADPEPIRRPDTTLVPPVILLTGADLSIGEIGPPSDTAGPGDRAGNETGGELGSFPGGTGNTPTGPDVSLPVLTSHHLPQYTDEAIKARVEGVVYLQVVIRKNGKADHFQVLRGLGYGLEAKAIEEIAKSWTFRPATQGGVAIDYPTLIEVTFSLR